MHTEAYQWVQAAANNTGQAWQNHTGLDLGGQYVNGSCREHFPGTKWTGLDWVAGPGIDIVADARDWEPDRHFSLILCTEMFEHVDRWQDVLRHAADALTPGGWIFLTCAGPGRAPHSSVGEETVPEGEHYGNVSTDDLRAEAEKYFSQVNVTSHPAHFDTYMWAVK